MDILTLALLIAIGSYIVNHQQQRKRIALLASHLGHYQIEKLMEALTEGYLRALGESTPERRDQIWSLLTTTESQLSEQFNRFAAEFAQVNEADARVSRFAMAIPFASQLFPGTTFDMRKALAIHARGIENMARYLTEDQSRKLELVAAVKRQVEPIRFRLPDPRPGQQCSGMMEE